MTPLRGPLARLDHSRDELAKTWLVRLIERASLDEIREMLDLYDVGDGRRHRGCPGDAAAHRIQDPAAVRARNDGSPGRPLRGASHARP